jgi:DNA-binding response OmpR family regulator
MSRGVVLVVEDDPAIRRGIVDALSVSGYEALESETGEQGLETALGAEVDLALVDVMLPGMDGFSMLAEIRKSKPGLPVIMVTALGDESDIVRGLDALGADDYVVKPFSAHELLARVKAVLRRSAERPTTVGTLTIEGREVDLEAREIRFPDGRTTAISEKGAELLQYLASCRGRAVKREELLQRVWGLDPRGLTTRTIDMHVSRLRKELDDDGTIIRTVRGRGYMLA